MSANALDVFLAEVRPAASRGRLIFGLDATASRKPAWDMAARLQAQMFREAAAVGNLDLQLVFYRGDGECKATSWISDPTRLARVMSRIDCSAGMTQIAKILTHVQKETALLHVGALVFIGDACEENPDTLIVKARDVGRAKTPAFMFQEGTDPAVQRAFQRATQGALTRSSVPGPRRSWANCSRPSPGTRPAESRRSGKTRRAFYCSGN